MKQMKIIANKNDESLNFYIERDHRQIKFMEQNKLNKIKQNLTYTLHKY